MTIAWSAFTPWSALAGGVLIGIAAAMLMLLNGRIAGISGVIGGLLKPVTGDLAWRIAFVLGLLVAPLVYAQVAILPALRIDVQFGTLIVAGLLVGVGTRYGSGCTSGHGVCGLARLLPRSICATAMFMVQDSPQCLWCDTWLVYEELCMMMTFTSLFAGLVFGLGLIVSGMANPAKVLGFLDLGGSWDPSLAFVMGGAVTVAAVAFTFARGRKQSLLGADMKLSTSRVIDGRLVLGSILFGVGWGIAGFCPGPALVALGMGEVKALAFVIAMLAGMGIFELLERRRMARLERTA